MVGRSGWQFHILASRERRGRCSCWAEWMWRVSPSEGRVRREGGFLQSSRPGHMLGLLAVALSSKAGRSGLGQGDLGGRRPPVTVGPSWTGGPDLQSTGLPLPAALGVLPRACLWGQVKLLVCLLLPRERVLPRLGAHRVLSYAGLRKSLEAAGRVENA